MNGCSLNKPNEMLALSQMAKPGRLFVPLDVNFFDDPRVVGLPIEARDLFLQILCLSKRTMSDGMVTIEQSRRLSTNADALLPYLTDVVLLEANIEAKTYQVVAWGQWNEEANSISDRSKIRAEAGRKGGITSGLVRRGKLSSKQTEASASSTTEANASGLLEHRDRVETEKEITNTRRTFGAEFARFWAIYPRRVGKGHREQSLRCGRCKVRCRCHFGRC